MSSAPLQPSTRDSIVAALLMLLCASAVAIMPNSAKLTYQEGSNSETVLFLRSLTGVILLGMYLAATGGVFRIPASLFWTAALASLSAALMTWTWYEAINYLDISLSVLIIFAHPLIVAFYYHFTGVSLLTNFRVFWGAAAFVGLAFALSVDLANVSLTGVALSGVSALFATTLLISMVRINDQVGGITTNFHLALWSLVLFSVLLAATGSLQLPTTGLGWATGIGNGFAYVTAYVSFLGAARLVGGSRASMLSFLEPIATILLAAALFGERLSPAQWGGVALVAMGLVAMEAPKGTWAQLRAHLKKKLSPGRVS